MKKRCVFRKRMRVHKILHTSQPASTTVPSQTTCYQTPCVTINCAVVFLEEWLCKACVHRGQPNQYGCQTRVGGKRSSNSHPLVWCSMPLSFMWLRQSADWFFNLLLLSSSDKSVQTHRDYAVNGGISKRATQPLMVLLSQCLAGIVIN